MKNKSFQYNQKSKILSIFYANSSIIKIFVKTKMIGHLINSNDLKKNRNKETSSKPKRENINSFGPSLGKLKQLDVNKKIRKMIHYDCNENANLEGIDDDVPDEDEVYVKENLLVNIKEKQLKEKEYQITE